MSKYSVYNIDEIESRQFDDESVLEKEGFLEISLVNENGRRITIKFKDYIVYRKMDEGDALETLNKIASTSELGHTLYLVEDSEFQDWFCRESAGIHKKQRLLHFCLLSSNSVIDILAFSAPEAISELR
ncbi:MAG: hypothetical protein U0942_04605 [Parvibaculum sp.]|uniref:hypothetical protein n=1 Tax=Parvibaculum sp. TaxID=2024848 RepID=UPI002ABB9707|nr:hypothetical protein [Parvibaculum sp.]MDZ4380603.1 hypothetical protein [Parvibaculum sp.]